MPDPQPPWRFSPGDTAFVRPALPAYRVRLIEPVIRVTEAGVKFPTWVVENDAGKQTEVLQIELSARPTSIAKGVFTLLKKP